MCPTGKSTVVQLFGVPIRGHAESELIEILLSPTLMATTVLYANPHVLNTAHQHEELHGSLRRASTVYVDGSGIRLGARILGHHLTPRTTAADWIDALCAAAVTRGVGIYLLAGAPGVAERAAQMLTRRHPGLDVRGTHHGYLDDEATDRVLLEISKVTPHLVVVGMGTPTQEIWIDRNRARIEAPVVWAVGALFDFVTGNQARAPEWLRRIHLEWLWRLGTDPVRLAGRYLYGNPLFLLRVLRQRLFGLPSRLGGPDPR